MKERDLLIARLRARGVPELIIKAILKYYEDSVPSLFKGV